ncbi:flagellar hook-associated protein 2 [Aequitasia blattaphilus]|uniref:Flagellar hook-associated protein 2 n=1 Tax=Aequitasia blattaphilus TaxID=2949332 RepID=A0ABT1E9N5_9FIRM|nr:flagellar filament capping protein FliD [Aequitasia blattaphilus]MCP1102533.1 flagellar filament capping protein FliD [Aequitasia blattaphilus]MCR8615173.1 flagellar filament capping protein FliD [Aequitasia blattaphilus]
MASIGGLSSSGMGNSIGGFGGLASGLDRDSLIEGMTYATRAKIAAQQGKKQTVLWRQEAVRSITSKMHEFTNKFISLTSSSSLLSGKLFSRNQVTALGANSKYISVSGSGNSNSLFSILGVKSTSKNAQATSNGVITNQTLDTGEIVNDLGTEIERDVVAGDTMHIKYDGKTYAITLPKGEGYDYSTPENAAESINKALEKIELGEDKTMADVLSVSESGGTFTFTNNDTEGKDLELVGHSGDLLNDLGFLKEGEKLSDLEDSRKKITSEGLSGVENAVLTETVTVASDLSGKSINFTYNGTTKAIKLGEYDENSTIDDVLKDLQKGLDGAFGKGRIQAERKENTNGDKSSFSFKTVLPSGETDYSSVLKISGGDPGLLGKDGYFGVDPGTSNRLNVFESIGESGLLNGNVTVPLTFSNGDKTITLDPEKFNENTSVSALIAELNSNKDLGINISYQEGADKFVIKSTEPGASGEIQLGGNLAEALFGQAGSDYSVQEGTDAVIRVQYAGSDEVVEIVRGENSFTLDGLTVSLNGTFGYDDEGNPIEGTEAITFEAKTDTESAAKAVKEMVDAFNEILELIAKQSNTKPNRSYTPLTDEQKKEMSETQIEQWEEKAKEGLLFGDSDLRGLTNELRFTIPMNMRETFKEIGISVSGVHSENGKLLFDEEKFAEAMAKDPQKVRAALSNPQGAEAGTGLMTGLKTTIDRYASMTGVPKGVLVERAGSTHSPLSLTNNAYQREIEAFNVYIDRLNERLKMEQDRYVRQFTSLESLVSQMNSQSTYLNQMFSQ